MPLDPGSFGKKVLFGFQHSMLGFRGFYYQQVAKAMFGPESQQAKPEITEYLEWSMGQLSNRAIRQTDKTVISQVSSGWPFLENLRVPAIAIKGKADYVPTAAKIPTINIHPFSPRCKYKTILYIYKHVKIVTNGSVFTITE